MDKRELTKKVFEVVDIEKALSCIKNGKAAGVDNITKEHLVNSHPALIVHFMILFNIIIIIIIIIEFNSGTIKIELDNTM